MGLFRPHCMLAAATPVVWKSEIKPRDARGPVPSLAASELQHWDANPVPEAPNLLCPGPSEP